MGETMMNKQCHVALVNPFLLAVFITTIIGTQILPCVAAENEKIKPQCGQYCIHFCCQLLGVPLTLDQVCEILPPKPKGETMLELCETLEQIGFKAQGQEITYEELKNGPFPIIAHLKMPLNAHFIVVEAADDSNVILLDGDARRKIRRAKDFQKQWTGYVLTISKPSEDTFLPVFFPPVKNAPRLQFDTLFLDAGEAPLEQKTIMFDFPFENKGTVDLQVLKVKSSCKCTVSYYPKHAIPPGGKDKISIEYDMSSSIGPFGHVVYVISNDPHFPIIELNLAGNTSQKLDIKPKAIDFGKVSASETIAATCFIRYLGDTPLNLKKIETDIEGLTWKFKAVTKETLQELYSGKKIDNIKMIRLDNFFMGELFYKPPHSCPQSIKGKIDISTNLPGTPLIEIPIEIAVVSPIVVRPEILFLGEIWDGKEINKEIKLSSRNSKDFRIDAVDVKDTGLKCEYDTSVCKNTKLQFQGKVLNGNTLADKTIDIKIALLSSDESFDIQIPVYVYLKKSLNNTELKSVRVVPNK